MDGDACRVGCRRIKRAHQGAAPRLRRTAALQSQCADCERRADRRCGRRGLRMRKAKCRVRPHQGGKRERATARFSGHARRSALPGRDVIRRIRLLSSLSARCAPFPTRVTRRAKRAVALIKRLYNKLNRLVKRPCTDARLLAAICCLRRACSTSGLRTRSPADCAQLVDILPEPPCADSSPS